MHFKANTLSTDKLKKIWKTFKPNKKFPRVAAYEITREEYLRIHKQFEDSLIKNNRNPSAGDEFEYGDMDCKSHESSAFVTENCGKFLIFRRLDSSYSRREDLEHELKHIYDSDLEKVQDIMLNK